ncbi:MAG: DUF2851 family protein [Bacteroidota bacterium]
MLLAIAIPIAMQELFLHYIWQFQYFDKTNLVTTQGETLQVIRPGIHNTDAGPDFSEAKVRIGLMSWAGNVEIHIASSEWEVHRHHLDKAYDSVVLHVVWNDDKPVTLEDGSLLPTLVLKGKIDPQLLTRYRKLMGTSFVIPCARQFARIPNIIRLSMIDRVLVERLEEKSDTVMELLEYNNNDWDETTYQLLAKNFGFKVNSQPFFQLAKGVPYKYLGRHANNPKQVEAMLFGQAGFLDQPVNDPNHRLLRREYKMLATKYGLPKSKLNASQWKFLRLRPANFPTVRLKQFCALICEQKNLFSRIIEIDNYKAAYQLFESGSVGASSIDNIIINSVTPILVAYGRRQSDTSFLERAQKILEKVPPENNRILRSWDALGMDVKNAFDSQAVIQLFNSYCVPRRCLDCAIGASLLKPGP